MRNLIILGCGRSGTSMAAGLLARSGYFAGKDLHAPQPSNPKGFFESFEINMINEDILRESAGDLILPLKSKQLWLSQLPLEISIRSTGAVNERIKKLVSNKPYCFKDPRFCYTLPAWKPFLDPDTVFLCVFRQPWKTALSIVREVESRSYLQGVSMDFERAMGIWRACYQHILQMRQRGGSWVLMEYRQFFDESCLKKLENLLQTTLDRSFPEAMLENNALPQAISAADEVLYQQLCSLAGYPPDLVGGR